MTELENRTISFTYDWWRDHKRGLTQSTALMNYSNDIFNISNGPRVTEYHLRDNLNCIIEESEDKNFTKIIFETEDQLIEFLLKYG